jgi:hypothetical protein
VTSCCDRAEIIAYITRPCGMAAQPRPPVMGPANRANLLARRRRKGHEKLSPPWSVAELGSAAVGHAALTPAASPIFRDMLRGAVPLPRFAGQDKETE